MKSLKLYIGALALASAAAGLSSCNDDFAQPPVVKPIEGVTHIGNGSWEDPYEVWQANIGTTTDGRTYNWVTGYIIGCINSDIANSIDAAWIGNGTSAAPKNNNIILAQYPYDEEKWKELNYTLEDCIMVQLSSGGCRKIIDLADHPENFNKLVSLRGVTGQKYMGQYGLRGCYEYNWGAIGRYEEPLRDIDAQYFCDFTASRDITYYYERGWSGLMEKGGLTGWYVTESSNSIRGLYCSAYYGTATGGPYINWVISPEFDLDKAEQKTLSFRTQASAIVEDCELEVYVMSHKNPKSCEPVKISYSQPTAASRWTDSGIIDLSEFSGKVYIGFCYHADRGGSGNCADFYVTDVNFGGANPADWIVIDPSLYATFRKASTLESGKKYAFVFEGNILCTPLAESANYGYMGISDIKIENNEFYDKKTFAFTITEDEQNPGSYIITDGYDRALFISGTYNSFNVAPAGTLPESGYLWKVEADGEGYKFTNIATNKMIEYSESFGNVMVNAANYYKGINPVLYELIDEDDAK